VVSCCGLNVDAWKGLEPQPEWYEQDIECCFNTWSGRKVGMPLPSDKPGSWICMDIECKFGVGLIRLAVSRRLEDGRITPITRHHSCQPYLNGFAEIEDPWVESDSSFFVQ
jgi:hypothetical protein